MPSRMPPHTTQGASLHQSGLVLKNIKGLLQTIDLSLATSLALSITLHLVGAFVLEGLEVLVDCVKLRLHTIPVGGEFGCLLVQGSSLLGLVLDILLLGRLLNGVFVGLSLVGGCCGLLGGHHLSDALGEIGLDDLKHTNDAAAGTIRTGMGLVSLGI